MTDDLAGDITLHVSDQHADGFIRNEVAVLVEQRLQPTVRYAAWVPVSRNLLADTAAFNSFVGNMTERWLRPWTFADRNPIPLLDLFPFVARAQSVIRRLRSLSDDARTRARETWQVLRHGLPDEDDW